MRIVCQSDGVNIMVMVMVSVDWEAILRSFQLYYKLGSSTGLAHTGMTSVPLVSLSGDGAPLRREAL